MLARIRRVPTLTAALALGLSTAAGAAAATGGPAGPAARPAPAAAAPAVMTKPAAPQTSTLPNGDRLTVTGTGPAASILVRAPDGRTVPAVRYAPDAHHAYVIPAPVLADPAQLNPAQYQVPALTTGPAAPAATPYYPLDVLQIDALGLDGKAADATTFLTNVDDSSKWGVPIAVVGGVARVAVPVGHYSALTVFSTGDPTTGIWTSHTVSQLDLTVAAGGVTTLNADERTATSQITASTPKPTVNDYDYLVFHRTDSNGSASNLLDANNGPTYVNPTPKVQVGGFGYQVQGWGGMSPAGGSDLYRYDVMFPESDHIDANQDYRFDASKVTTVHNTVDTDAGNPRREGEYLMGSITPELGGIQIGHVIPVPAHLTTYTGAPVGDAQWEENFITALPGTTSTFPAALLFGQNGNPYQGPVELSRTWAHGPLTPQVGQYRDAAWCRSCAGNGTIDLNLNPVVDTNPDTNVDLLGPANGHLNIYRDGSQVFSQDDTSGTELTDQARQPGTYRLVYDQDLSQFPITQSTVTHTDITVPYTPAPNPKWTLPSDDYCRAQGTSTTACSVLPMLNLNYQLATDDTNTSHSPVSVLALTVGHQSYGAAGAQAAATGVTVSVSFDKGTTWTAASVVPAGQSHFVALWKNAGAKGGTPWLKVTATDALGGSITQTVANAYTIG